MVSFDDDNDQEILREALVTSQLRVEKETTDSSKEVLYNDGATPLFTAIEETKWADALDLLEVVPEQASIWVTSTGTENTTFGWSLWRRLPIHEVCILKSSLSVASHFFSHGRVRFFSLGMSSTSASLVSSGSLESSPFLCGSYDTVW